MDIAELSLVHRRRPAASGVDGASTRPPLLLLLHGVGSNERSMARLAPAFDARFDVLSVRSPIELGPDAYGWFHVTFTANGPVIDAGEAQAAWEAVARFIAEAADAYGADPERVFLCGFSQGGIMSLAAMLTAPALVAGAAMMSGRLLPEVLPFIASTEALRDKPVLIVHGTADTKLGIAFARNAREQLSELPLALSYHELLMGHQVTAAGVELVSNWLTARLDA